MNDADLNNTIAQGQKDYLRIMNATKESIKNELLTINWAGEIGSHIGSRRSVDEMKRDEVNSIINNKIQAVIK